MQLLRKRLLEPWKKLETLSQISNATMYADLNLDQKRSLTSQTQRQKYARSIRRFRTTSTNEHFYNARWQ